MPPAEKIKPVADVWSSKSGYVRLSNDSSKQYSARAHPRRQRDYLMDVSEPGTALRAALRRLQGVAQVLRQTALQSSTPPLTSLQNVIATLGPRMAVRRTLSGCLCVGLAALPLGTATTPCASRRAVSLLGTICGHGYALSDLLGYRGWYAQLPFAAGPGMVLPYLLVTSVCGQRSSAAGASASCRI